MVVGGCVGLNPRGTWTQRTDATDVGDTALRWLSLEGREQDSPGSTGLLFRAARRTLTMAAAVGRRIEP